VKGGATISGGLTINTGNVGIGTIEPKARLHVAGGALKVDDGVAIGPFVFKTERYGNGIDLNISYQPDINSRNNIMRLDYNETEKTVSVYLEGTTLIEGGAAIHGNLRVYGTISATTTAIQQIRAD
jgi:hypothetical protein